MAFDEHTWREQLRERLQGWKERMARAGVKSVYAFLSAATLWPVAHAAQQGDWAALMSLGGVLGGIGSNLVANQIQQWKDEADGARRLEEAAKSNEELRQALDTLLEKLETLRLAGAALDEEDRAWFREALRQELAQLGSRVHLDDAAAVIDSPGAKVASERSLVADEVDESVITSGDQNVIQQIQDSKTGDILAPGAIKKEEHHHYELRDTRKEARQALQRYLLRLRQECRVLPLAALGGDEDVEEEVTLDQVYIALNTRYWVKQEELESLREGTIRTWQALNISQEKELLHRERDLVPLPVWEAVQIAPKMVILGDPGSGKSTFVKRLAEVQASVLLKEHEPIHHIASDLLPILVVLRDLVPKLREVMRDDLSAKEQDTRLLNVLNTHLEAEWQRLTTPSSAPATPIYDALTSGRVLLVLDGLDEVPLDTRTAVRALVKAVLRAYTVKRVIVTSRTRSYTAAPLFRDWPTVTLQPFTKDQIATFVRAWYRAQTQLGRFAKEEAEKRADNLTEAALSESLLPLATNPMLLTTMTLIHQREVELPDQRVQVYSMAVDILIRRWRRWKAGRLAASEALEAFLQDDTRLRPALEHLAFVAHTVGVGQETADISRAQAMELLEGHRYAGSAAVAEEFLDYVDQRAGLLVGRGGDAERPAMYSFPHRTFQEYLAGCYVMGRRGRERKKLLKELASQGDSWNLAVLLGAEELFYNRRRLEEVMDIAYELCESKVPQTEQDWRWILWSGEMALLVGLERVQEDKDYGGPEYIERLRHRLVDLLRAGSLLPAERTRAGDILAQLGDPRFDPEHWYLPREPLLGFVPIPAGEFIMGSDPQKDSLAFDDEQPQHRRSLPTYYIARYPVTVAQFRAFVEESGYKLRNPDSLEGIDNHPVVWVTWYDALAYARWLDRRLKAIAAERLRQSGSEVERDFWEGLVEGRYSVTLPSEAEWEKAARGGLQISVHRYNPADPSTLNPQPDRVYPWGNDPDPSRANYDETGIGTTSAVGCFPGGASPYGVEEMSGNVWEWTRSVGKEYPYNPTDGRENLDAPRDAGRVLRGGSFLDYHWDVRCSLRFRDSPDFWRRYYGFRVVVSPFATAGK